MLFNYLLICEINIFHFILKFGFLIFKNFKILVKNYLKELYLSKKYIIKNPTFLINLKNLV